MDTSSASLRAQACLPRVAPRTLPPSRRAPVRPSARGGPRGRPAGRGRRRSRRSGERLPRPAGVEVLDDLAGCWVFPGFVDPHAHLRTPGYEYKEDLASGSLAAAAGGYVTVVAMANTDPVVDSGPVASWVLEQAARGGRGARRPGGLGEQGPQGRRAGRDARAGRRRAWSPSPTTASPSPTPICCCTPCATPGGPGGRCCCIWRTRACRSTGSCTRASGAPAWGCGASPRPASRGRWPATWRSIRYVAAEEKRLAAGRAAAADGARRAAGSGAAAERRGPAGPLPAPLRGRQRAPAAAGQGGGPAGHRRGHAAPPAAHRRAPDRASTRI